MTVHNQWATKPDPKTGLPVYPVRTASTASRLTKRAEDAAAARTRLQQRLDDLTAEFESAYVEADKLNDTRQRIAAHAKTHRTN